MLDLSRYRRLRKEAKYKPDSNDWFEESYPVFTSNQREITKTEFLRVIAFAYSWMPTIPTVRKISDSKWVSLEKDIVNLTNLENEELKRLLLELVPIINNSIVGTSKVLHFLAPDSMPIIDSRVIRVWRKEFKKEKSLSLKATLLAGNKLESVVDNYLKYRKYLLAWQANCKGKVSLRELESVLYYQKIK